MPMLANPVINPNLLPNRMPQIPTGHPLTATVTQTLDPDSQTNKDNNHFGIEYIGVENK